MSTSPNSPQLSNRGRPRWSLGRKLALQLALLPLLVLALEVLLRVSQSFDPEEARAMLLERGQVMKSGLEGVDRSPEPAEPLDPALGEPGQEVAEPVPEAHFAHPFFGYDSTNAIRDYSKSARYFSTPAADETYDILVVGGSVAARFAWHGMPRVREILEADPRFAGTFVRVHGYGRGGFKQPQQLNMLTYLLALGFLPDAVINIDGFNEVALGYFNSVSNAHPVHPSMGHWGRTLSSQDPAALDRLVDLRSKLNRVSEIVDDALARGFHRSYLLTRTTAWRLRAPRAAALEAYEIYLDGLGDVPEDNALLLGPSFRRGPNRVLELVVRSWAASSHSLQDLCEGRGMQYLHVLQPTLHDAGSKPVTEEEEAVGHLRDSWIRGAARGYPMLREAGRVLADEGVHFLDSSMVFVDYDRTTYVDGCHFDEEGSVFLAESVAAAFLDTLPEGWQFRPRMRTGHELLENPGEEE